MSLKKPFLVWTSLFVVLPMVVTAQCPSSEDIAPCSCKDLEELGTDIKCHEIDNEELAKVASSLEGTTVYSFTIEDSKLGVIPHNVFKGIKVKWLKIEKSTIGALTDSNEAFFGLEDHLEKLEISSCVFKNEWNLSVLKNLKKLKNLEIWDSLHLESIGENLMKLPASNLEVIIFYNNSISVVSDHAFDSYESIRYLTVRKNNIKDVKRTMLPNPALELRSITISYNMIEQLPEDMFTSMPNLDFLDISGNKIQILSERTFSPVWEQLAFFWSTGNDIRCDCSMSWLPEKRIPESIYGECASPPELKRKRLEKLESNDFVCNTMS